jgi:hypothetical protein
VLGATSILGVVVGLLKGGPKNVAVDEAVSGIECYADPNRRPPKE